MSDYTVCQYCNGYETTAGFMHEARCPLNKSATTYYNVPLVEEQAEIKRQKYENMDWLIYYSNGEVVILTQSEYDTMRAEIARLRAELEKAKAERDEARKWARHMFREATIAQQNHVSAVQSEMITGSKLFDRETRLTTLAKELGRVQRERDAELERAVEAEAKFEQFKAALFSVYNRGYKTSAAVAVADVCDTELDRSGRLLGEIRDASIKLKGY